MVTIRRTLAATALGLAILGTPAPAFADWPMLGANPQRTSWVADEVRGRIKPVWYRPIEPYINYKVQVIAADGRLFVTTARGLYALDATNGDVAWVYPTELPLGHSPTYANGVLYVGSYDRTIHAVDAATGRRLAGWAPFVAMAGFETNPLVVNGRVYAGSRDGHFYCLDAKTGRLFWRFKTDAAIRNSAALDGGGVIYFASEDLHAYALKDLGDSYQLVWRSEKMLGDSFASYWPVVYRDWVIFSGSEGYMFWPPHGTGTQLMWDDKDGINANLTLATATEPGDWAPGTVTMDASPILQYYEGKPYRRRVFMLRRADGREYTFDSDGDGVPEYAPFTFSGAIHSGPKYPPVVGVDGVLYTHTDTVATSDMWTPQGALVGWKVGTRHISRVMDWGVKQQQAADEPMAFSMGGRVAYWSLCCDRESGAFDVTIPFGQSNRWWNYWGYSGRFSLFPNYQPMYSGEAVWSETSRTGDDMDGWFVYGAPDGFYGRHGTQSPWVPYNGMIYRVMGNTIVAAAPWGTATAPLPMAQAMPAVDDFSPPDVNAVRLRLEEEIQKMVTAGHLKPGLFRSNVGDDTLNGNSLTKAEMDQGTFYFSSLSDTVYAMVRALPHVSTPLQEQARAYIQAEMAAYPIDVYAYVGHVDGTPRQAAVIPPDHVAKFTLGKQTTVVNNLPWKFPMMSFYAAWKYAQLWPSEASRLYTNLRQKLTLPPAISDAKLLSGFQALNAYLAGYRGFLELEKLAGMPESAAVRSEYDRLFALRIAHFSIDAPFVAHWKHKNFIMARHFLYMVPEVAEELRKAKASEVERALERINKVTPYWFVAGSDSANREGSHQQLYDAAILNGYAMILQRPYREVVKYLDAPAFLVGDLLYIHNLVSVLEAAATPAPPRSLRVVP